MIFECFKILNPVGTLKKVEWIRVKGRSDVTRFASDYNQKLRLCFRKVEVEVEEEEEEERGGHRQGATIWPAVAVDTLTGR